ncbi:hypothetical protein [Kitasatospora sp. HPMI-4]|uniref:hypothetical protein n=1 Tax=Kitasatospora sp. HPMI-4 TaxID=3448443 RepID=UPI003F1A7298
MSRTPNLPDADVRYLYDLDRLHHTMSIAGAEARIRTEAAHYGALVREWNTAEGGQPLRVVRVEYPDAAPEGYPFQIEIPAWYRVAGTTESTVLGWGDDFPEPPAPAAAFEDLAREAGWMTQMVLTADVAAVTAGRDAYYNGGAIVNPAYARTHFTLTWKRDAAGWWRLRTQESVTDGMRWGSGWSSQSRIHAHIAEHPVAGEPAVV